MGFERTYPRRARQLTFLLPDGWKGEVVDLSVMGLRIQSVAVLDPQMFVEGSLVLEDGRAIPLKGFVVWSNRLDPGGRVMLTETGLQLVEVPDAYRELLSEIFAE